MTRLPRRPRSRAAPPPKAPAAPRRRSGGKHSRSRAARASSPPSAPVPPEVNGARAAALQGAALHAAPRAELLAKYQALLAKHTELVERLSERNRQEISLLSLTGWALESHANGLLLVEDEHVRMSNPRWDALTRLAPPLAPWCLLDGERRPTGHAAPGLREAALEVAGEVLEGPLHCVRTAVFSPADTPLGVELHAEHLRSRAGRDIAVLMARDVTAQLAAERELRDARETSATRERMRALGEVVAGVTHDLNSTLQALKLRLQLLQADPVVQAAQAPALRSLLAIVGDASGRVDRLHDFARQRSDVAPQAVDLGRVIAEAVEMVRTEFTTVSVRQGGAPVRVALELPRQLPPVRGWPAELRYVLVNLLLNARDAMPRGGTVTVRAVLPARGSSEPLSLEVEDEGGGILPEQLSRIFEPLFTTKRGHHSGLGLSMAYGLMARLGGSIRAANRPEGGARFELLFPLA